MRAEFAYDGGGIGKGGTVSLFTGDTKIGEGRVERTRAVPVLVRRDRRRRLRHRARPCRAEYAAGDNAFTGTIDWVRIDIGDDDHDHLIDPQHAMQVAMLRQ